ncbi:IncP plasmid survival protein KfrC family protein [Ventosimonas gracilis]|uniref:IncP plasmid survival protein KfrC family protein n=1 Tax=Ventosimonas gracilis TaxID=1680762 RepID=UPI00128F3BA4|nr:IncP plasmid survival protein KfrC family protein [Ventosimonas gracilis]
MTRHRKLIEQSDSLLHQAEQSASEQRALLENASLEQTLTATLKPYVEAKHEQIERIEAKLGQVIEQQQAKLKQVGQNPPKHKWLSSKKTKAANTNAWHDNKNKHLARLHCLDYRKYRIEKIKESTDSRFPTVDQLATQKMRREHPELAASWDAMRESVRIKQQKERGQREKQARQQTQSQSQSQGFGLRLGHRQQP